MSLSDFVLSLPKDWATCPIYRFGVVMPNGQKSSGKPPLGKAHHEKLSPRQTNRFLEREPETFGAVGVFAKRSGIVILDIDANLGQLTQKYGEDLHGPHVMSEKANAGKWVFSVPAKYHDKLSDLFLSDTKEGWEALWDRQGVVAGAYKESGTYTPSGDFSALPEAPRWLLERMEQKYEESNKPKIPQSLEDAYMGRTTDQNVAICKACLSVLPKKQGPSDVAFENLWFKTGAALHHIFNGSDVGLSLFRDWSREDPFYEAEWQAGEDPCAAKWDYYNANKGRAVRMGWLITTADEFDPQRARYKEYHCESVIQEIEAATLKIRPSYLSGSELLEKAKDLEDKIENPALLDQAKHLLALDAGRRHSGDIDRMLDQDLTFERNKGGRPVRLQDVVVQETDYLIPGLLPKPFTLLVHGDGGTGKSAMCQTLAKHVLQGLDFNMHGANVPVQKGKVLWLNGDQNERILRRQFKMIDAGSGIKVMGEWDMSWYRRFCKYQKAGKYDLVVIDSLDGCNDSNPYEENRREFALPIKRLARRNGIDFPACSIVIIHHNTKEGKFRGTSAIRAAVDETWNMRKVSLDELMSLGLPVNTRMVTVEKSRDDREGQQMVFSLLPDYTYKIGPVPETETTVKFDTPNQHTLDLLAVMRADRKPWSVAELVEHETVGGEHRKRAIRYGLQRLEQQALIERCDSPVEKRKGGRQFVYYRATGTDVPAGFRKGDVRSIHRKSVSQLERAVPDCDPADKPVLSQLDDCHNSTSSTPTGACSTEASGGSCDKPSCDKQAIVNESTVPDWPDSCDGDPWVNKQIDQNAW